MLNKEATEEKVRETIRRGKAYPEAGADGVYPILIKEKQVIQKLVDELAVPVNILTVPGIPVLKTLYGMGVARVSLGLAFQRVALQAMKQTAVNLQNLEGLDAVTSTIISMDFL